MNLIDKLKLFILTIVTDVSLFYIYLFLINTSFDKYWLILTFIVHVNFYIGIVFNLRLLLDFLHLFVFLLPFLTLFLLNWYLKLVSLIFVLSIQILWINEERCILNEPDTDIGFGFGKLINIATLFLGTILSYQLGLLTPFF